MDALVIGIFLLSTFIGGITTGLAGFAMGLVVSGVWLHILTPIQTAALITGYGLLVQGYGVWKLRHAFDWRKVAPYIISGAVGVPIGTALLNYTNPTYLRIGVGVLLILYAIYGLAQPKAAHVKGNLPADVTVGFFNGLLGALTGLAGIIIVIWCQLHGWGKDVQRSIFQPVIVAAFVLSAISLGLSGAVTADTVKLYLLGLPVLFAGTWTGMKLYGHLDEAAFRRVILILLLLSGIFLVVPIYS